MTTNMESGRIAKDDSIIDMMLLLECLKFQKDSVPLQKQALRTLASMCQERETCRDLFRTSGCLEYVCNLVKTTMSKDILQAGLYALASGAEANVINQMKLSDVDVFNLLVRTLSDYQNVILQSSAVFLAINLMYNNSQGQNASRNTKLLHKLVDLFKCGVPVHSITVQSVDISTKCWLNLAQAISVSCDNPQNELNQSVCCGAIPAAVSTLHCDCVHDVIKSAITVIIACVSNNIKCQSRLSMVGGLKALGRLLNELLVLGSDSIDMVIHVARCLCAATSGNDANIKLTSTLNVIPQLLLIIKRLQNVDDLLTVILCIEALTENNPSNQRQLVDNEGVNVLISIMANTQDLVLNKVITVLLQSCVMKNKTDEFSNADVHILQEISKLTDAGLTRLEDTPYQQCSPNNKHSPESSGRLEVMPSQCNNDTHFINESLKNLASAKLPTTSRVQEWLNHAKYPFSCPPGNTQPSHEMSTNTVTALPAKAHVNNMLVVTAPKFRPKKIHSSHANEMLQCSFASESQVDELRHCLVEERLQRAELEKRLTALELSATDRSVYSQIEAQSTVQPDSTISCTSSKRNVRMTAASSRRQSAHINSFNKSSTVTYCIGCHGSPGIVFTSRTLLSSMCNNPNTCRYHKRITNTILTGNPLVINNDAPELFQNLKSASNSLHTSPHFTGRDKRTVNHGQSSLTTHCLTARAHKVTESTYIHNNVPQTSVKIVAKRKFVSSPINFYSQVIPDPANCSLPVQIAPACNDNRYYNARMSTGLITNSPISYASSLSSIPHVPDHTKDCDNAQVVSGSVIEQNKISLPTYGPLKNNTNTNVLGVFDYITPLSKRKRRDVHQQDRLSTDTECTQKMRRPSLPFSKDEVRYLIDGVNIMGHRWKHILTSYPFHKDRSAMSLKDKYKLLLKRN